MKRVLKVFAMLALCGLVTLTGTVAASGGQAFSQDGVYGGELRVGLTSKYSNLWSITLATTSLSAGFERSGFFYAECTLESQKGLVATADSSYYVKLGGFSSYSEAKSYADSIKKVGYRAAPCITGVGNWVVYAGGYEGEANARSDANGLGGAVVPPNGRRIVLMENNDIVVIFDSSEYFPQFAAQGGGTVSLGERRYRGRVELMRQSGQNLTAVNVVTLDQYLYSVVPSEMPNKWHVEALKAQAVACRSYTVTRMKNHTSQGFDVCDAGHCQNYLGAGNETDSTTLAVDLTRNVIIWYQGQPVNAVYFSSSGGSTDSSENVWNNAEPYLRGVKDNNEKDAKSWTRTYTLEDINKALSQNNVNIGNATGITIGKSDNGRVQELLIHGTHGTKPLYKEEIRTFFQNLPGGTLESRNFTIGSGVQGALSTTPYAGNGYEYPVQRPMDVMYAINANGAIMPVAAAGDVTYVQSGTEQRAYAVTQNGSSFNNYGDSIVINGSGSGHGVGMSQHGAQGLAEMGYSYEQILKWYYTGVDVR